MIFSRKAVEKIITFCGCPSIDSPDDMIIGKCSEIFYKFETLNLWIVIFNYIPQDWSLKIFIIS